MLDAGDGQLVGQSPGHGSGVGGEGARDHDEDQVIT